MFFFRTFLRKESASSVLFVDPCLEGPKPRQDWTGGGGGARGNFQYPDVPSFSGKTAKIGMILFQKESILKNFMITVHENLKTLVFRA